MTRTLKKTAVRAVKIPGRKKVNATKATIDGIEFASTIESKMYTLLKKAGIPHTYEGKSYITLEEGTYPSECYERATKASKQMIDRRKISGVKYTPDFIGENEAWFIEVKGRANESFSIRWKLFKQMLLRQGKNPIIFKPMTIKDCEQVIEILKAKGYARSPAG